MNSTPLKFIDKLLVFPASGDVRASGTGRVGEEGRAMRPMKSVRSRRTLASKNQLVRVPLASAALFVVRILLGFV